MKLPKIDIVQAPAGDWDRSGIISIRSVRSYLLNDRT